MRLWQTRTTAGKATMIMREEGSEGEGNDDDDDTEEEEEGEKWLKHYSMQSILLVGDGDFSSLALATAFRSGANLVATSLDTYGSFLRSTASFFFPFLACKGAAFAAAQ
jgi:hypothetical protein